MKNFTFDLVQVLQYNKVEIQAYSLEEAIDKVYELIESGEIEANDSSIDLENWEMKESTYVPMSEIQIPAETPVTSYVTMQQVQQEINMQESLSSLAQFEEIDLLTQMAKLINTIEECSRKVAELEQLDLARQALPNGYVPMTRAR